MKRSSLYPLRWHLAALTLCLICSGLMLHLAWKRYSTSEIQARRAEQQAAAAAHAVRQFAGDESRIRSHIERFQALQKKGVFGIENPAERPGLFRKLQRDLHIDGIDYEFSEPAPFQGSGPATSSGGFNFQSRRLQLHMSLLHEEDLIRILDQLCQRAPALLRVRECQIERAPETAGLRKTSLLAKCGLDWITVSKTREG